MAEGEDITFGDFDFSNSDANIYQNLFGGSTVPETSVYKGVQFPWDSQENYEIVFGEINFGIHFATQSSNAFESVVNLPTNPQNIHNVQSVTIYGENPPQPLATISPAINQDDTQTLNKCAINEELFRSSQNSEFPEQPGPNRVEEITNSATEDLNRRKRNKKQRDPNYYNNYYKNPELYSRENELSNNHNAGSAGQSTIYQISSSEANPTSNNDLSETSINWCPPDDDQRDASNQIGNNVQNVQLDERTNSGQHAAQIVESRPELINKVSTSDNFPNLPVPPIVTTDTVTLPVPPIVTTDTVTLPHNISSLTLEEDSSRSYRPVECQEKNSQGAPSSLEERGEEEVEHIAQPSCNLDDSQDVGVTTSGAVVSQELPVTEEGQNTETVEIPVQAKPSPSNKPTSWASLFRKEGANSVVVTHAVPSGDQSSHSSPPVVEENKPEDVDPVTADKDPQVRKLGEYLKNATISNKSMFIQPRGLINVANNCYINSILQVLVACPPFHNLFQRLPLVVKGRGPSSTPMLDAVLHLCRRFVQLPSSGKKNQRDMRPGEPFEPVGVYQMLRKVNTTLSIKQGKQEDAEEFLSCLLNGFHEEMLTAMESAYGARPQQANGPSTLNGVASDHDAEGEEDEEWEQVGPKKKATITRVADFTRSPIYDIFGGQMRSALHQQGVRESAMLQPFFTLQLDIQSTKISSVKEALENFGTREAVHGFMSNKTKTEVEASKRTSLEVLPPVLILHLKQFVYDKTGGCQKLTKKMEYEMDLEISRDLLSPSGKAKIPQNQRNFKLFAVIYHTGKEASGGHYITDLYHVGTNGWIRADDNIIKMVKSAQVLNPHPAYTPYLLFYRRREMPLSHSSSQNSTANT